MTEELDQLENNDTWTLVPKHEMEQGHRALGCKWAYEVKRDVDGSITRFKARWLVKDYLQQYGVDFDQTYAAVVKPMAFRVLSAIAAYLDLDIDQMDVKFRTTKIEGKTPNISPLSQYHCFYLPYKYPTFLPITPFRVVGR